MARQSFDCVRNCIAAGTGDTAVGATTNKKVVKVVAGGSYDYGEPAVELVSAITDIPYGVQYSHDDAGKVGICNRGLVVVEKSANAEATDVGKKVTASATVKGAVDISATTGGFGVVVAIEGTSSKNLLVEITCPQLDTPGA